jgi:hypothetical protein
MSTRASKDATKSQLSLAFFSIVCVALHPGFVLKGNEGGFSNYGIHIKTAIPYSIAFLLAAFYALKAGRELASSDPSVRLLRRLLMTYSALMVLALVSTYGYTLNGTLKDFHFVIGGAVMVFEPVASAWLYAHLRGIKWDGLLFAIEIAGLTLGMIDFFDVLHVLFLAQVLMAAAFGFLLVHAVSRPGLASKTRITSASW